MPTGNLTDDPNNIMVDERRPPADDLFSPQLTTIANDFFEMALDRRFPELAQRVVFISGGAFTPAAHAYLDRVPNERLAKPFQAEQIRAVVRRYV